MPLLDTFGPGSLPARREPAFDEQDDLVLGWECAVPALHVEAWEPGPVVPQEAAAGAPY